MTQTDPMRIKPRHCVGTVGKRSPFLAGVIKVVKCKTRAPGGLFVSKT